MSKDIVRRERRIQILEALHQCLLEKPFHQTTIKEIARKAGVNHGLLHYYFENKQDLLLKYIDHTFHNYYSDFLERFARPPAADVSAACRMEERFQWVLGEVAFNRESARIFMEIWAMAMHNEAIRQKLHELYNRWQRRIVDLMDDLEDGAEKASRISLTLIALTEGLSLFSALFSRDDLCRDISFMGLINCLEPTDNQQSDP